MTLEIIFGWKKVMHRIANVDSMFIFVSRFNHFHSRCSQTLLTPEICMDFFGMDHHTPSIVQTVYHSESDHQLG